jgi:hypothetical protein
MITYGEESAQWVVKPNQVRGQEPAQAGRLRDIPGRRRMSQDYRWLKADHRDGSAPTVADREVSGSSRMRSSLRWYSDGFEFSA